MIGVFYPDDNSEHATVLTAFYDGVKALGHDVVLRPLKYYQPVDIAVVFGVFKKHVANSYLRGHVLKSQRDLKKKTIVLEKGYIRRDIYYAAGWGGLNNRANFNNTLSPPDRFSQLGIDLKPYRYNEKGFVLLIGQVPTDASVQHTDHIEWLTTAVQEIKRQTNRRIVFRPHPLARDRTPHILGAYTSTRPLEDDLNDAWAVVTFNSNTGVDAILQGVSTFSFDLGSMVWNVTNHEFQELEKPRQFCRRQWAANIAYTQWTLPEMAQGLPFQHLTKRTAKPSTLRQRIKKGIL